MKRLGLSQVVLGTPDTQDPKVGEGFTFFMFLGNALGRFGVVLGPSWVALNRLTVVLSYKLFGAILEPSWGRLRLSWAVLSLSESVLGSSI